MWSPQETADPGRWKEHYQEATTTSQYTVVLLYIIHVGQELIHLHQVFTWADHLIVVVKVVEEEEEVAEAAAVVDDEILTMIEDMIDRGYDRYKDYDYQYRRRSTSPYYSRYRSRSRSRSYSPRRY
ncbi:hypothetical protein LTLLF_118230 [Microtus ochrogaster]|uniref:Uncharacterized protein n=1 Tax=Microtus ochrogaster TaxID=79684 RepID=A0A8J6L7Y8_MICOH|nr:hypothetical protein LTLLF_118230 [Microtus ochrogaster]